MRVLTNSSLNFALRAAGAFLSVAAGVWLLLGAAPAQAQTAGITYNGSLSAGQRVSAVRSRSATNSMVTGP